MDNQIETLKNLWENSRSKESGDSANTGHIIKMAKEKMKRTRRMQLDTILILSITLAIIALYFTQVVQLNETLSRIGAVLMTGGLAVRILIECYSICTHFEHRTLYSVNTTAVILSKYTNIVLNQCDSLCFLRFACEDSHKQARSRNNSCKFHDIVFINYSF